MPTKKGVVAFCVLMAVAICLPIIMMDKHRSAAMAALYANIIAWPYTWTQGQNPISGTFVGVGGIDTNSLFEPLPITAGGTAVVVAGTDSGSAVDVLVKNTPPPQVAPAPTTSPITAEAVVAEPLNGTAFPVTASSPIPISASSAIPVSIGTNPCSSNGVTTYPINYASAASVGLVQNTTGNRILVCGLLLMAGSTTNVQLGYTTGTVTQTTISGLGTVNAGNCPGTVLPFTGPMPLTAQAGWVQNSAANPIYIVPSGDGLCLNSSAANQVSGSITYVIAP